MEFQSQFIQIGSVQIRYYGIIIVAAMLMATFVAVNIAKRSKRDPEHVYGALTWAIIPGIIFARLWFVFFPPLSSTEIGRNTEWYLNNFFNTIFPNNTRYAKANIVLSVLTFQIY